MDNTDTQKKPEDTLVGQEVAGEATVPDGDTTSVVEVDTALENEAEQAASEDTEATVVEADSSVNDEPAELEEDEDDAIDNSSDDDEPDELPVRTSPETNQAMGIMQIEGYINAQMTDIAKLRDMMKDISSSYNDAFANDASYRDLDAKAKEAAKAKNNYKKQMMGDPALQDLANKLDGMKSEMRDLQTALSDYLREYNRVSGMTQFETKDGEILEIVNVFKLVKKKD
jgi:hypothetical protein